MSGSQSLTTFHQPPRLFPKRGNVPEPAQALFEFFAGRLYFRRVFEQVIYGSGHRLGGEDHGLSKTARSQCDYLVRLPMRGRVTSLNSSVAASILLYETMRQRHLNTNADTSADTSADTNADTNADADI